MYFVTTMSTNPGCILYATIQAKQSNILFNAMLEGLLIKLEYNTESIN